MPEFFSNNRVALKRNPQKIGTITGKTGKRSDPKSIKYQVTYDDGTSIWITADAADHFELVPPPPPKFSVGNQVSPGTMPEKTGVIVQSLPRSTGNQYMVFFGSDDQGWYAETNLRSATPVDNTPKVTDGSKFLRDMALIKIKSNLSDTLYSYRASRTKVEPYQFKPAIKFFESPNQRLLIADEVGLGKTIEAGIIYLELNARADMKRVLVVCPSGLREKWERELLDRFGEEFEIFDSGRLRERLDRYAQYGDAVGIKGIVSMETIRGRQIADKIEDPDLDIGFDLVIIDEAHHMRNPGTQTNNIGKALSHASDAVVMLSATPIQLRSDDLFHLLQILDEGQFEDRQEFAQLIEPNVYINQACQALSTDPSSFASALKILRQVEDTTQSRRYTGNPLYDNMCKRLQETPNPDYIDVVEIQRGLQQINTFAPILNRTTKREVGTGIVRRPTVIGVTLTPEERNFYESVLEFSRKRTEDSPYFDSGVSFASIQTERQAASCITAAREYILGSIDDPKTDLQIEASSADLVDDAGESQDYLVDLRDACDDLGETDSKLEAFMSALSELRSESPNSKVIVFAFFKRTLEYLRRNLNAPNSPYSGSVHMIHGGVKREDRSAIIDAFRRSEGFGILLLSEIGSEGMDFQFCDTVINYDLPWNPMRVEQRIGRVDRYGQQSESVRVYSLVINDTVEDRILKRLYDRIKVFEQSIGDIETILGEQIQTLQREIFRARLTPEEENALLETNLRALESSRLESEEFEQNRDSLMGQDIIFQQEFNERESSGKFISGSEIKALVQEFIDEACPLSSLRSNPRDSNLFTLHAERDLQNKMLGLGHPPAITAPLMEKCRNSKGFPITFDGELGLQRPLLELLNLQHPVVTAANKHFAPQKEVDPLLRLANAIASTDQPDMAGEYAFFIYLVRGTGAERLSSLAPIVIRLDTQERAEDIERRLLASIQNAEYRSVLPSFEWRDLADISAAYFADYRDALQAKIESRNNAIIDSRIAGLRQTSAAKVSRWRDALSQAESTNIQNMRRGQINREPARLQTKIDDLEAKRGVDISGNLVLAGYIRYVSNPLLTPTDHSPLQ